MSENYKNTPNVTFELGVTARSEYSSGKFAHWSAGGRSGLYARFNALVESPNDAIRERYRPHLTVMPAVANWTRDEYQTSKFALWADGLGTHGLHNEQYVLVPQEGTPGSAIEVEGRIGYADPGPGYEPPAEEPGWRIH